MDQLEEIGFDFDKDRLFATGDIIDRGEDSISCLGLVYEPWFFSVRGNHEELMFDAVLNNCDVSWRCWMANGGEWFLSYIEHYKGQPEAEELLNTIRSARDDQLFPLGIEIDLGHKKVGIVHGEPPAIWHESMFPARRQNILWGTKAGKAFTVQDIDEVYVGHRPVNSTPMNYGGNVFYIDSGAVFSKGAKLCVWQL